MLIGVLALQGAFREHILALEKMEIDTIEVKSNDCIKEIDGLIIPGGESTTMGKLLDSFDLRDEIKKRILSGMPVWGTCAGMILLAKDIGKEKAHLKVMNIRVKRNGYGRQLGSFISKGKFANYTNVSMPFIRAPYIEKVGKNVEVLSIIDGKIVAARENNILVTSFHPEITDDLTVLEYFVKMIE
ncbi:pyridoxal 5'-phosphate synthase glutaminase subunit PdxT [Helicovermis profundi]|uniref:Pyridoxal 5'-phosphate synthase subunit PdxT n=2 Tax=Helicovermis profundi TaxID=3065157 RepID=A0AAU9E991_9FIRM|nr:pyridoxal 5'-phosphate synthase glutaminase subunit PdxT [Clostridia bacterium S502]